MGEPQYLEQQPQGYPMFVPGDFQSLANDGGADDLVPFHRYDDNDIVYETPRVKAKIVGGKYLKGEVLGEGSYSKVKEMLDCQLLCRRAVKIMKQRRLRKIPNGEQNVRREIRILSKLHHKNVIRLVEVFEDEEKQKMYVVLEYCVGGLQELLERCALNRFPLQQAHSYFVQLVDGLEYLHSKGIVHKDIKPGNLLLTSDGTVKITDFGVGEELDQFGRSDDCTNCQGSPAFQPPEIASGQDTWSGFKADIWAAGVTLYQFVTGKLPFEGDTIYKLFNSISSDELKFPPELPQALQSLLHGMLAKDPAQRLTIAQIKQHPWLLQKQPVPLPEEVAKFLPYVGCEDPLRSTTVLQYLEAYYSYGDFPQPAAANLVDSTEQRCDILSGEHQMGYGVAEGEVLNHGATSEQDLMLPTIGEDGEVFEEEVRRESMQHTASDDCLNVDESHNIARRVSVVSSAEDVLFPSAQANDEEDDSEFLNSKTKDRKKSGMSKKISSSCQQQ